MVSQPTRRQVVDFINSLRAAAAFCPRGKQIHATTSEAPGLLGDGVVIKTDTYLYEEDGQFYFEQWQVALLPDGRQSQNPTETIWLQPQELREFAEKVMQLPLEVASPRACDSDGTSSIEDVG
jgi:hypothetical protein